MRKELLNVDVANKPAVSTALDLALSWYRLYFDPAATLQSKDNEDELVANVNVWKKLESPLNRTAFFQLVKDLGIKTSKLPMSCRIIFLR